MKYLSPQK